MADLFSNYPFLDEKESGIVSGFDAAILIAQLKKRLYLREIARKKGIIAEKLEDLKSECGRPFLEEKGIGDCKRAVVKKDTTFGPLKNFSPLTGETAYLCQDMYSIFSKENTPDGCGWVKGKPYEKKYDEIGVLSGSRGIRYYCRICGKQIGEYQSAIS